MHFKLESFIFLFRFIAGFVCFLLFRVKVEQNFGEKHIVLIVKM